MNVRIFMTIFMMGLMVSGPAFAKKDKKDKKEEAKIEDYLDVCSKKKYSGKNKKKCLKKVTGLVGEELKFILKDVVEMISSDKAMPKKARAEWKGKVLASQEHWAKYKDAECQGVTPYKFWKDKQSEAEKAICDLRLSVARLKELDEYLGGDDRDRK